MGAKGDYPHVAVLGCLNGLGEVDDLAHTILLYVSQTDCGPAPSRPGVVAGGIDVRNITGRKNPKGVVIGVDRHADLFQIVLAT